MVIEGGPQRTVLTAGTAGGRRQRHGRRAQAAGGPHVPGCDRQSAPGHLRRLRRRRGCLARRRRIDRTVTVEGDRVRVELALPAGVRGRAGAASADATRFARLLRRSDGRDGGGLRLPETASQPRLVVAAYAGDTDMVLDTYNGLAADPGAGHPHRREDLRPRIQRRSLDWEGCALSSVDPAVTEATGGHDPCDEPVGPALVRAKAPTSSRSTDCPSITRPLERLMNRNLVRHGLVCATTAARVPPSGIATSTTASEKRT